MQPIIDQKSNVHIQYIYYTTYYYNTQSVECVHEYYIAFGFTQHTQYANGAIDTLVFWHKTIPVDCAQTRAIQSSKHWWRRRQGEHAPIITHSNIPNSSTSCSYYMHAVLNIDWSTIVWKHKWIRLFMMSPMCLYSATHTHRHIHKHDGNINYHSGAELNILCRYTKYPRKSRSVEPT